MVSAGGDTDDRCAPPPPRQSSSPGAVCRCTFDVVIVFSQRAPGFLSFFSRILRRPLLLLFRIAFNGTTTEPLHTHAVVRSSPLLCYRVVPVAFYVLYFSHTLALSRVYRVVLFAHARCFSLMMLYLFAHTRLSSVYNVDSDLGVFVPDRSYKPILCIYYYCCIIV